DPEGWRGYYFAAEAALALGKPKDGVVELLRQSWAKSPESERRLKELTDKGALDVYAGDFAAAEKTFRELDQVAGASADLWDHVGPASGLVNIHTETGDLGRAARVASDFVRRKDAWTPDVTVADFAVESDVTPRMLLAMRRGGALSQDDFQ